MEEERRQRTKVKPSGHCIKRVTLTDSVTAFPLPQKVLGGREKGSCSSANQPPEKPRDETSPARPDMALWGDAKLFLCILVVAFCCTVTLAEVPQDCCLDIGHKKIDQRLLVDYRQQIAEEGCHISATVFVTRRGKKLCLPANKEWVTSLMKHVDHVKAFCKKHNYKGPRCVGVTPQ